MEEGGERYREMKKEYNKMCERKRKEEGERWVEIARSAKTGGQVWEVVNREKKKRGGISEGIKWWNGWNILRD